MRTLTLPCGLFCWREAVERILGEAEEVLEALEVGLREHGRRDPVAAEEIEICMVGEHDDSRIDRDGW